MATRCKETIGKICITVLNFVMLALACMWMKGLPRAVLLCVILLFATLGVMVAGIDSSRHASAYRFFLLASVLCAVALVCYAIADVTGFAEKCKDIETLRAMIRRSKQWGVLIYIGLVIFQVIFLPIPSAVIALLGTVLYGATYSFIFMTIGTLVGSIITFAVGKIFGRKLVVWVIGEEKTDKYATMLDEKGRFLFAVMMLFPFFPDDVLCMVAGMTKMSFRYFLIVVSFTRPVMIAFMCYFGSGTIIPFRGWGIPVWIGLFVGVIVLFFAVNAVKKKLFQSKSDTVPKKKKTVSQNCNR